MKIKWTCCATTGATIAPRCEDGSQEAARDAVEVIKVAKARLDHGEQMLAIFRQEALRLA
eukprot:CAMPEP_0118832846 /NCGR_PEP_ID=MMETSP1162-20130426/40809_1 /TAXON_ID=33656 /ORGANISM="Phaeocystis Sp, Strain CCMP2710" /LENGTH=59 /DNA_ID=CAMNT_0006764471 /DNA_START=142 /DNA_END=319 /DNA_ORIENTATION=-